MKVCSMCHPPGVEVRNLVNDVINNYYIDSNKDIGSDEESTSHFRSIGNDELIMKEDEQM